MKEISPLELRQWLDEARELMLVDVREPFERAMFHIGGFHIPMNEAMKRMDELTTDNNIPVVVYCEKGIRSAIVIQRLEQLGFTNLYNLSGGISAWKKAID